MNTYKQPEIEIIQFEVPNVINSSSTDFDDNGYNNEVVKP